MKALLSVLSAVCVLSVSAAVNIGGDRQVLWDDHLVDVSRTTADVVRHEPERMGAVLAHDQRWEGNLAAYYNVVVDKDGQGTLYRLYYKVQGVAGSTPDIEERFDTGNLRICYAESRDGITWTKPNLGINTFEGSTANNIVADSNTFDAYTEKFGTHLNFDNFYVFKDENPACPADQRYKAIACLLIKGKASYLSDAEFQKAQTSDPEFGSPDSHRFLWCYVSTDGIHFTPGWWVARPPSPTCFDSLNIAHWDAKAGCYELFARGWHDQNSVRDVRTAVSSDFHAWTELKIVDFSGLSAFQLYTSAAQPYRRAPGVFLAMPMRYYDRGEDGTKELTINSPLYQKLPDYANRLYRWTNCSKRQGTAITDMLLGVSRDAGTNFVCSTDTFLRPGPEHHGNWLYGDANVCVPVMEMPSAVGGDNEMVFYSTDRHYQSEGAGLVRYRLRLDGFFSRHAEYAATPKKVVTKELVYTGKDMFLNLSTSAAGSVKVTLKGAGGTAVSDEIRGDAADHKVTWASGSAEALAGQTITAEFELNDADLYAFRFGAGEDPRKPKGLYLLFY